jgi:hypothetical protein
MKKAVVFIFLLTLVFVSAPVYAAKDYIYRHRANWVKVDKLSNKQLAGQQLSHPYQEISSEQMAAILLSITIKKGEIFKSEKKTIQVFSAEEAGKFAPLLVQALGQASPNEVVNMAIVHKRPYFIVRKDLISVLNIFVQGSELHLHFTKIFAKLEGDYKQASRLDRAVSKAKSVRVDIVTMPGQVLTADGKELIMDLGHDFLADATANPEPETPKKDSEVSKAETVVTTEPAPDVVQQGDMATRLKKLDQLRKEKLITKAEYQEKKFKILEEL